MLERAPPSILRAQRTPNRFLIKLSAVEGPGHGTQSSNALSSFWTRTKTFLALIHRPFLASAILRLFIASPSLCRSPDSRKMAAA
ncbi:hypothetical protein [Nonomuraea ceibae]|uniref:hypothetical protein n=1 Tax=Nonomuraea ceibae TaxID=1935170 RepID=UPI001C5D9D97|nr:hypothetical protein [Nonomuraea ceibae]